MTTKHHEIFFTPPSLDQEGYLFRYLQTQKLIPYSDPDNPFTQLDIKEMYRSIFELGSQGHLGMAIIKLLTNHSPSHQLTLVSQPEDIDHNPCRAILSYQLSKDLTMMIYAQVVGSFPTPRGTGIKPSHLNIFPIAGDVVSTDGHIFAKLMLGINNIQIRPNQVHPATKQFITIRPAYSSNLEDPLQIQHPAESNTFFWITDQEDTLLQRKIAHVAIKRTTNDISIEISFVPTQSFPEIPRIIIEMPQTGNTSAKIGEFEITANGFKKCNLTQENVHVLIDGSQITVIIKALGIKLTMNDDITQDNIKALVAPEDLPRNNPTQETYEWITHALTQSIQLFQGQPTCRVSAIE